MGQNLRAELQPVGELENLLVDRIIASYWRLRRLGRVETGIFAWERSEELAERAEREAQGYESDDMKALMKATSIIITDERGTRRLRDLLFATHPHRFTIRESFGTACIFRGCD